MKLKRILATRGIHYLVTRFGPAKLRGMAFDEKYERGDWNFQGDGEEMPIVLTKYLRGGDLLILGCGAAPILDTLEPSVCASVLGVDLSEEAVRRANRFAKKNVGFQVGDMVKFQPPTVYDVILFSESLNYVPASQQVELLQRLTEKLKPGGVILVTFAQPKRYEDILVRVREHFAVVEDRAFTDSTRHLIVFKAGAGKA